MAVSELNIPRSRFSFSLRWGSNAPALALVSIWSLLALIIGLLLFVIYMSFVPGLPTAGGFTLANWSQITSKRFLTHILPNTFLLGLGSSFVATFFGFPIAWLLNRTDTPLRRTMTTFMAVMIVVPGYVSAMGWVMLIDPRIGILNSAISAAFGIRAPPLTVSGNLFGMAWVIGLLMTPAIFFLVSGPMRSLDPALGEAASMSGAGTLTAFWRVDLRLLLPSVLGALIYVFISAVSNFEVPALLGGGEGKVPVLATSLFYAIRPAGPQTGSFAYGVAGVYGLVLAAPCLAAMYFYLRLLAHSERYQVISGKGYRSQYEKLGRFKPIALAFLLLYVCAALILPLLVLLWASLLPVLQMPSIKMLSQVSLMNYEGLFVTLGGIEVFYNTVILVISVATLVTFFSLAASWIVVRTRLPQRKTIDVLCMLPHAVPGLAFAFALAMLGILAGAWAPALSISDTVLIIVIAHLILRLPYGTRLANASLIQVHHDLEEAAQMSGADMGGVIFRVLLPLVRGSIVYLVVWTVLLTLQEVSIATFLSGPRNMVLSVNIFQLWIGGNMGPAAAATVILAATMAIVTAGIFRTFGGAEVGAR